MSNKTINAHLKLVDWPLLVPDANPISKIGPMFKSCNMLTYIDKINNISFMLVKLDNALTLTLHHVSSLISK